MFDNGVLINSGIGEALFLFGILGLGKAIDWIRQKNNSDERHSSEK